MQQIAWKIWNLWDEHAALQSLRRLPGETNTALRTRILNLGKFKEDSTRQGLVNAISSAMGYDQYNVLERRIFILTHIPYRTSTFTVTYAGTAQTQIDELQYPTSSGGYIIWKDENEVYGQIMEFIVPPAFTRDSTTRKHSGGKLIVTYQYEVGDRVRWYTDECNPYDEDDESFMGWATESEGSVGVHALNDTGWIDNPTNGWKNTDGTPTEQLRTIWREVDAAMPSTWGP